MLACAATAYAEENHDFQGSYLINGFYMDYTTEDFSMDPLPLVIGEDNRIDNFANYTPFTVIESTVEGNTLTLEPNNEDGYIVLDINWDTFHYVVLNGATEGEDFEYAPISLTYHADYDSYEMTSWELWDYDPMSGEFQKQALCYVYGVEPGEPQEEIDFTGTYTVVGKKTVYTDGVAGEPEEATFTMALRPDADTYEFTQFAGYEVGMVPRGWLGVFGAVYGGTDIEIQGTDIELDEAGNGIKLAAPYPEYDDMYTVTVFFDNELGGNVSNFSVWRMEAYEPVELLEIWSYLSFTKSDGSGIETPAVEAEASDALPVYYDLNGIEVKNPANGIYIMKQGSKTKKVVIRK